MSQPQNYGGPPEGRDPYESSGGSGPVRPEGGPNPQQPPAGPGPQHPPSGPDPQYPPQGPQQQPPGAPYPPSGAGPPYVSGGTPQYPGTAGGGGGQGPPYPPPGGPGQGWYQQPPSGGGRNTGLIIGIVVAVSVLLLGVIALVAINLLRGDDEKSGGDTATEESATEDSTSGDQETSEPPSDSEAVDMCLPYEPVIGDVGFVLSSDCSSADAFWKVTAASHSTGATVDSDGQLTDNQVALDLCGAEHGAYQLGELWKDWYFTYDTDTGTVEQLLCVEAIGNPDASGRLPITPDTGACFDDSDQWWTVPCEQPSAVYVVVDTVAVDPPAAMTSDEADSATAPCSGGALFWQVVDVEGRTTDILCGDEL